MSSLKEVAKLADVSTMTVSRVINGKGYVKEETRKRVFDAVKKLNYYPNNLGRGLTQNKVNIIAVLAPIIDASIENNPYFTGLLYGIEQVLTEYSYDILLSTQRKKQINGKYYFDYLRPYNERKADALILMGATLSHHDLESIADNRIPFCVIGDRIDSDVIDVIDTNNREGIKFLLEKIYQAGHTRIAFGGYDPGNFNISERFQGYREFLEEKNLQFRNEWIFRYPNIQDQGKNIMEDYVRLSEKPTVIVCSTDRYAIEVIFRARSLDIDIPGDLSITGCDGINLARHITPQLTTMIQPLEEMGKKAANLIIRRLKNPEKSCETSYWDLEYLEGKSLASPAAGE